MIPFSLKQLAYFVAAAELESVSDAARKLHISQPSISNAIAGLEEHYGQPMLVRRHGCGVSTTPFGREFLGQAKQILNASGELSLIGEQNRSVLKGTVVIGCYPELAPFVLPSAISDLKRTYPGIQSQLVVEDFSGLAEGLDSGRLDLVINYDMALKETVIKHTLKTVQPYALLPADHPLSRKTHLTMKELLAEPFILSDFAYSSEHFLQLFASQGLTPNVVFKVRSFELMRGLVAHGHGVSAAYSQPMADMAYDGKPIACRPLTDTLMEHRIVLARSKSYGQTPIARATWSVLSESVAVALPEGFFGYP